VAVFVAVLLFGPWMLSLMVSYTRELFVQLPMMIR
jgi:flagellar biosynthetic protein FliQ